MVGNAGENVCEPCLGIDVVEATGLDQRVRDRRPLATAIGAAKQPRLAPERHRPFILPMSAKSGKFTILGIPISGKKLPYGG